MQPTIFVSIAAYRDPELFPTMRDMLARADAPTRLHICVCDQFGPEGEHWPAEFAEDSRIHRIAIPWQESKGACWARATIMDAFGDQDFFLQLDSHHRFVDHWDTILLEEWQATGRQKALLTGYVNPYTPGEPLDATGGALVLGFDAFHPDGIVVFRPHPLPKDHPPGRPVRARFISGHFLFAPALFVHEVPYDPELYFIGEEISLSVRAFLEGWYLFHPSRVICFHEYTRKFRENKHWSDHEGPGIETPWWQRDQASRKSVTALLLDPERRGSVRTLKQYQDYAGVHFARQRVHSATLAGMEPPTPVEPAWETLGQRWNMTLRIPVELMEEAEMLECWQLDVIDEADRPLFRRDIYPDDLQRYPVERGHFLLRVAFDANSAPAAWTFQPHGIIAELSRVEGAVVPAPPEPRVVWVTALLDLGRHSLPDPRAFDEYHARLTELLRDALPHIEVVVYADPSDFDALRAIPRNAHLELRPFTFEMLRTTPHFGRIESLRQREEWRTQADWLSQSPQALLPGYAALVMHKLRLLAQVASQYPADTNVFWVDAGLTRTVAAPCVVSLAAPPQPDRLQWLAYPYPENTPEIHGFSRAAIHAYAGTAVTHVVRGGFFGGLKEAILRALPAYEVCVAQTLADGYLGTEESIFSLLHAKSEPGWQGVTPIPETGLIPWEPFGRVPWIPKLPVVPDRIAIAHAAARLAALDRTTTPAHIRFEGPHAWAHAALLLPFASRGDVATFDLSAPGEPAPTMAFVQGRDIDRALEDWVVEPDFRGMTRIRKVGEARPAPDIQLHAASAVYVLTYNAPQQLALWMEEMSVACPALLDAEVRVVINNSTDSSVFAAYDGLCSKHGFEQQRFANVGITGGRIAATQHFLKTSAAQHMWYFEDDMLIVSEPGVCRNGFQRQVPDLFALARDIVAGEPSLDCLKLSFSEHFGCHQLNWAWVNADADARAQEFLEGSSTRLRTIRVTRGQPWALGDVHYSHWPTVLTRRGAELLIGGETPAQDETAMMMRVHALQVAGEWQGAVLLASPIEHRRAQAYAAEERIEFGTGAD